MEKKFVLVKFDQQDTFNGKQYSYFTDLDLQEEDKVVIDTGTCYKVATVASVRGLTASQRGKAQAWIVARVDTEAHTERIRRAGAAQEIRNKLAEAKERTEELMIYQHLAKSDPDIKKLLLELAEVDDSVTLLE